MAQLLESFRASTVKVSTLFMLNYEINWSKSTSFKVLDLLQLKIYQWFKILKKITALDRKFKCSQRKESTTYIHLNKWVIRTYDFVEWQVDLEIYWDFKPRITNSEIVISVMSRILFLLILFISIKSDNIQLEESLMKNLSHFVSP